MILVEILVPGGEAKEIAIVLLRMAWVLNLSYLREHFESYTAPIVRDDDGETPESTVSYRLVPDRTFVLVSGARELEFVSGLATLRNDGKVTTLSNDKELMKP